MSEIAIKLTFAPQLNVAAFNVFIGALKQSLGTFGKDIQLLDAKKLEKELKDVETEANVVGTAIQGIGKKLNEAGGQGKGLGAAFQFNQITQSVQTVVSELDKVAQAGVQYEANLKAVQAITGQTDAQMEVLGGAARRLAKEFGGSANDQLKSYQGILSKFGAQVAESPAALEAMARSVNILSAASGDDAATSMNALTDTMLQLGLVSGDSAKDAATMAQVADALAASAQVGAAEIPQVSAAILQAGVAAKGANLDINQTTAAIQVLAVGGKTGSEAGIALRNVLGSLQLASSTAEKTLQGMGTSSKELGEILTTKGLGAAMEKLSVGMNGLGTDAERNVALMEVFGKENAAAAGIFLDNADKLSEFTGAIGDAVAQGNESAASATAQAAVRMNSSATTIAKVKAQVEDVFIGISQTLGQGFTSVIGSAGQIAPLIGTLSGLKNVIPEGSFASAQKLATTILSTLLPSLFTVDAATGVTSANFSAMWAASGGSIPKFVTSILSSVLPTLFTVDAATGVSTFSFAALWTAATGGIPLLIGGLVALGAGIYALYQSSEGFRAVIGSVFDYINEKFNQVKAVTVGLIAGIKSTISTIGSVFDALTSGDLKGAYKAFSEGGENAGKAFAAGAKGSMQQSTFDDIKPKLEEGLGEGLKVKARIDLAEAVPKLTKDLEDTNSKLKPLQLKVERGEKLTDTETKEFDALQKKAEETTNKIKQIAPEAVTGMKNVTTATGEMKQVYEVNTEKAIELAEAQKKISGTELQQKQQDYSQKLLQSVGIYEQQKARLKEVGAEAQKAANAGDSDTAKKKIAEYNELKTKVEENGAVLVKSFNDGAKAGLLAKESTDKIESGLGIAKGTAEKLSTAFQGLKSGLETELSEGVKVSAKIDLANAVPQLTKDLEETNAKLKPLQLKVERGETLTDAEKKQFDDLQAKAEETTNKIKKVAPEAVTGIKQVMTSTGEMKQVYEVNTAKANELAEAQKQIGGEELKKKQGEYSQKLLQTVDIYQQQKTKLAEVAAEADKAGKAGDSDTQKKKIEEYNQLKTAAEKSTLTIAKGFVDGAKAGLLSKDATDQLKGSMGLTVEKATALLEEQKKQEAAAKATAGAVEDIGKAFEESLKAAKSAVSAQISELSGLEAKRNSMKAEGQSTAELDKQIKLGTQKLKDMDKEADSQEAIKKKYTAMTEETKKKEKSQKSAFELAQSEIQERKKLEATALKYNELKAESIRLQTGKKKSDEDDLKEEQNKLDSIVNQQEQLKKLFKVAEDGTISLIKTTKDGREIEIKLKHDEQGKAKEIIAESNNAVLEAQNKVRSVQIKLGVSDEQARQKLADMKFEDIKVKIEQDPSQRANLIAAIQDELTLIDRTIETADDQLKAEMKSRRDKLEKELSSAKKEQYKADLQDLKDKAKKEEEVLKSTMDKELRFAEVINKALGDTQKTALTSDKQSKLKELEERKKNELISEEEFNTAKEKLDKEFSQKELTLNAKNQGLKQASEILANKRILDLKKANIQKELDLEIKTNGTNTKAAQTLREQLTEVDDAIKEKGDLTSAALDTLNETLTNSMNNLFAGNLEGVKDNFRGLLGVIAGALEKMAAAAVIQLVFSPAQIANSSLLPFPFNLIGLGVVKGLVEQGLDVILSPILNSITSFSTGGIATSPQLAIVGDRSLSRGRDNTELILGLDQVEAVIRKAYIPVMQGLEARFDSFERMFTGLKLTAEVSFDKLNIVLSNGQQTIDRRIRGAYLP